MDRPNSIVWLHSVRRGMSAEDCSESGSILLTVGEPTTSDDGVTSYPGIVSIYPATNGEWNMLDCNAPDRAPEPFPNLESAVKGAHDYVARKALAVTRRVRSRRG